MTDNPVTSLVDERAIGRGSAPFDWLIDSHRFPAWTFVDQSSCVDGIATVVHEDDDGVRPSGLYIIDCNAWPPTEQCMSEICPDAATHDRRLIAAQGEYRYWLRTLQHSDSGAGERTQFERSVGGCFEALGPVLDLRSGSGAVVAAGVIYAVYWRPGVDGRAQSRHLLRVDAHSATVIFEWPGRLELLPLGPGRILIAAHNESRSVEQACYWLWGENGSKGNGASLSGPHAFPAIAIDPHRALAWLGGDEILFCSASEQDVLRLHRFDVVRGTHRVAPLEGLGGGRSRRAKVKGMPEHLVRFWPRIDIGKGASSWWIFNDVATYPGKRTICWFWNQDSNAVIELEWDPARMPDVLGVLYSPGIDGYLLSMVNEIHRLADLDGTRAAQAGRQLRWT